MKLGLLCLLLLPACSYPSSSYEPIVYEYALTWYCISPGGCEHAEELEPIDRVRLEDPMFLFTSTQDASFSEDALLVTSDTLEVRCSWMYFLSLLGHELERSKFCFVPGGFELELSIPNDDATTYSQWVVAGADLSIR